MLQAISLLSLSFFSNSESLINVASSLIQDEHFEEAYEILKYEKSRSRCTANCHYLLGISSLRKSNFAEALVECEKVLQPAYISVQVLTCKYYLWHRLDLLQVA